jgi:hypothetical protein
LFPEWQFGRALCQILFHRNPPESAGMTGFRQESVGQGKDLLQMRVGGSFLLYGNTYGPHPRPTLAPNASRWAVLTYVNTAHPRYKRKTVGHFFSTTTNTHGPTLAPNARRWALVTHNSTPRPTLAPNARRWALLTHNSTPGPTLAANTSRWVLFTLRQHLWPTPTAHPRSKCESVGRSY